jgi:hypothetical protein
MIKPVPMNIIPYKKSKSNVVAFLMDLLIIKIK